MNDADVVRVHRGVLLRFAAPLVLVGCMASTYAPRPHRFDSPASIPQETARIAQRMSGDVNLRPTLVDANAGTILAPWRITGVSGRVTIIPPGETRSWLVQRYRVFVRPNVAAPGSSVFVDLEQFECETSGFNWTALELHGNCRPITEMTDSQLRALDATGASLRG